MVATTPPNLEWLMIGTTGRARTYDWVLLGRVGPVPAPFACPLVGNALGRLFECEQCAAATRSNIVCHCSLACRAHSDSRRRCGSQDADRGGSRSLVYCRYSRRLPGRGEEGLRSYVSLEIRGKQPSALPWGEQPIYLPRDRIETVTWEAHKRSGESMLPTDMRAGSLRRTRCRMTSFPGRSSRF